jgi:hypothetical protein
MYSSEYYFIFFFLVNLSRAHDASTSVDGQSLSGDEGRSVRGQEGDRGRNLFNGPDSPQRVSRLAVLQEVGIS